MGLFFGGLPTRMDVDKLMELEPSPGKSVTYEKIAETIGVKAGSNRFRTVTEAWRKRLFRERLLQSSAEGGAFHFLNADQAHDLGRKGISRVGKMAGRVRLRVEAVEVDSLTGERRDRHNLLRREAQAIHEAAQKSAKAIAAPQPVAGASLRLAKN